MTSMMRVFFLSLLLMLPNIAFSDTTTDRLEVIRHQETFEKEKAEWTLALLFQNQTPEIRAVAADVLYLHVHYKRGQYPTVTQFLLQPHVVSAFERILLNDSQMELRTSMARIGQILLGSFSDLEDPKQKAISETLTSTYLPILISALQQNSDDLKTEIFVALDNLSKTDAFRTELIQSRLRGFVELEKTYKNPTFPELADWLNGLLTQK